MTYTNQGARTIAEMWTEFSTTLVPVDAPAVQRESMRLAFYAGAEALFNSVMWAVGGDDCPSEVGEAYLTARTEEIKAFAMDLQARLDLRANLQGKGFMRRQGN